MFPALKPASTRSTTNETYILGLNTNNGLCSNLSIYVPLEIDLNLLVGASLPVKGREAKDKCVNLKPLYSESSHLPWI